LRFEKVKKEISKIAKIISPKKTQEEVRKLDYNLNIKMKIKRIERGYNWVYYYKILGYDDRGHEILSEVSLGRIKTDFYNKNKNYLERLRKAGDLEKLKKYFE